MSALRSAVLALSIALPLTGGAEALKIPGAPGELRGSVSHADGTPVESFTVNGVRFENPRGAFHVLVPPEGTFRVVVRAPGLAPGIVHVQGAAGKKLVMPDIVLGKGEDVVGEVLDAETGEPLVGAFVALADPAQAARLRFVRPERLAGVATTGAGGFYVLRGSPRALLMLVVHYPGYLPEFVPVNTRDRVPPIALHHAAAIQGVVRDRSGTPAPGVSVVAVAEDESDAAETVADAAGRILMQGLRPGRYVLTAVSSAGKPQEPGVVDLAGGRTLKVAVKVKDGVRRMQIPEIEIGAGPRRPGALAYR